MYSCLSDLADGVNKNTATSKYPIHCRGACNDHKLMHNLLQYILMTRPKYYNVNKCSSRLNSFS